MSRNKPTTESPDPGEIFPPLSEADEHGLLAIGGPLDPTLILSAYRRGIFPWPMLGDRGPVTWFAPPHRAILPFENFTVSRSLEKERRRTAWTFAIDKDFRAVIEGCQKATNRKIGTGTWITTGMLEAYVALHEQGWAHSVGCYENDALIGGIYGISIGGMFAGESMYYEKPNASKLSLCFLVDYLRSRGAKWLDCQQLTPLLQSFGAKEIRRDEFQLLLRESLYAPQLF